MSKHFGKYIKEILKNHELAIKYGFEGCSESEIESVMKSQHVTFLPRIFREYLETMGKSGGLVLFEGFTASYSSMHYQKGNWVNELNDPEWSTVWGSFSLPEDAFVFINHHDYEYYYFLTKDQNNDPPVYFCSENENEDKPVLVYDRLSNFFEENIIASTEGFLAARKYRERKRSMIDGESLNDNVEQAGDTNKNILQNIIQNIKNWFI